jgi:hypothetical protein
VRNRQVGPDHSAQILADLVPRISYKPSWEFRLEECSRGQGCEGLTLLISALVPNSFGPDPIGILHLMPVNPAAYDEEAWIGWILEQIEMVEKHEMLEFYRVDGDQPFMPTHSPGRNPYSVFRVRSREEAHAPATPWSGGPPVDPHFKED